MKKETHGSKVPVTPPGRSPPPKPGRHHRGRSPEPEPEKDEWRQCNICWKWIKGDMGQHQQTSQACKKWQKGTKPETEGVERKPCPKCDRMVHGNLWSLWQHFLSVHPGEIDYLADTVPKEWLDYARGRSAQPLRMASAKRERYLTPVKREPDPSPPPPPSLDKGRRSHTRSRSRRSRRSARKSRRSGKRSSGDNKLVTQLHERRHRRRKRRDSRSPPVTHKPLDKGPGPGPGPGSSGGFGGGQGVASLLIHIGQALASERPQ